MQANEAVPEPLGRGYLMDPIVLIVRAAAQPLDPIV